ncbi:alpha/beta hydrolase, partial [Dickeya dianthicola]
MMKKRALILLSLFSLSCLAEAKSMESKVIDIKMTIPPVRMESDITYSLTYNNMGRPIQLSMDLLQPYSPKPLPTVLFITGGGFMDAPKSKFIGQRVDMARAGYVVASINYRVVPMVTFPGMLEDVKTAVRYLRANAVIVKIV